MIFGFRIWQVILAIVAFPFLAGIGIVILQDLQDRDFQPQTIQPQTIDQQKIKPQTVKKQSVAVQKLTPAANLVGSWHGQAKYIFHFTSASYCYLYFDVVLFIASQQNNAITGNVNVAWNKAEQHGNFACATVPTTNDAVKGTITGSKLAVNAGSQGDFSGSFTTDTISLFQSHSTDSDGLVGSVNLLRQHN